MDTVELKCIATNPDPVGKFEWTIGGEVVKNDDQSDMKVQGGDTLYSQVFEYKPKVNKSLG